MERATVDHVLAQRLDGPGGSAIELGDGAGLALVAHVTVSDAQAGVRVETPIDSVTIRDSIFSMVSGAAVDNHVANAAIPVAWFALDRAGAPLNVVAEGVLADERCLDPFSEDLALLAGSACVDAGSPDLPCGDEPGGVNCRLDLGHLGGTVAAQAR